MSGLCVTGSLIEGIDDDMLASFMTEVDDPQLRAEVLAIARAMSAADRHLADAELTVIAAQCRHWGVTDAADAPPLPAWSGVAPGTEPSLCRRGAGGACRTPVQMCQRQGCAVEALPSPGSRVIAIR